MIQKRLLTILSLMIIVVMALSACGPTAPPGQVPPRQDGKGGYLDEIDVSVVAQIPPFRKFKPVRLTCIPLILLRHNSQRSKNRV